MNLNEIKKQHLAGKISKQEYIEQMHSQHLLLYQYADLLKGIDIDSIEILKGEVIMTSKSRGVRLYASRDDMRIASMEMLNFGAYDEHELNVIEKLIPENVAFFDIGANIGWYSLNLARMESQASIYAFEPIPKTFACLQKNIALNEIKNISVYPHGFSDQDDTLTFYYYPEVSGNASLANLSERPDVEQIDCQVVQLDEFMENYSGTVDFIKCDVEGAELFVFKGGIETIKKHKPVIFTEMLRKWAAVHNYHPNEIIDLLDGVGYDCFVLNEDKLTTFSRVDEETIETNFFFLHREKHAAKVKALVL